MIILCQMFINDYDKPPLEALSYLTGQCNYGGRVTDDLDRRLITSLLEIFYNDKLIFDDTYKFSPSGLYFAPPKGSYDEYVEYIRNLPLIPHPEVRGRTRDKNVMYSLSQWVCNSFRNERYILLLDYL